MSPENSESLEMNDQSIGMVLDVFRAAYEADQSRLSLYENRAGILLALAGLMLSVGTPEVFLPHSDLRGAEITLQILASCLLVWAMVSLVLVLLPRKTGEIQFRTLGDPAIFREVPETVAAGLFNMYKEAIKSNEYAVLMRLLWFRSGLWAIVAGVVFTVASHIVGTFALR